MNNFMLTPQIIAEVTGGQYIGTESARHIRVQGAARDNRDVMPDNLFVCIRGERNDGHDFAQDAFARGASCALAERELTDAAGAYVLVESTLTAIKTLGEYYRKLFDIPFIGITGSVGKTTSKELVAAALSARFCVLKTEKNLNNELGVPLTLLSLEPKHQAAVIEMGISEFGEMSRIARMVRPDICVMTKIGHAHLEQLGDLYGVLQAKTEAFAYMNASGIGVMNGDDEMLRRFDPGVNKITFGIGAHNDFRAENIRMDGVNSVSCDVVSKSGSFTVTIPAYGLHLAMMALPAAAVGILLGMSGEEVARGLSAYVPVDGRANVKETGMLTIIDDCYNANPTSVNAALKSLSMLPGRHVAILGAMKELGKQSAELHRDTGVHAAQCGLDVLITCGQDARFIGDGYAASGGNLTQHFADKSVLIAALPGIVAAGDNVLVKASNSMRFDEIVTALAGL